MLKPPKTAQNGRSAITTACVMSGFRISSSLKTGERRPMTKLPTELTPFLPLN